MCRARELGRIFQSISRTGETFALPYFPRVHYEATSASAFAVQIRVTNGNFHLGSCISVHYARDLEVQIAISQKKVVSSEFHGLTELDARMYGSPI